MHVRLHLGHVRQHMRLRHVLEVLIGLGVDRMLRRSLLGRKAAKTLRLRRRVLLLRVGSLRGWMTM